MYEFETAMRYSFADAALPANISETPTAAGMTTPRAQQIAPIISSPSRLEAVGVI